MRWIAAVLILAVAAAGCNSSSSSSSTTAPQARAAITVNGVPVSARTLALLAADVRFRGGTPDRKAVVQQAVDDVLIAQEAKRRGITVSDDEVQKAYEAAGGDSAKAALGQYGIPLSHLRDRLRAAILTRRLTASFPAGSYPLSELREQYQKHIHAFHTPQLVRVSSIQVRNPIQGRAVITRLNRGADFDTLARQISLDPDVRQKGPDQGWKAPGLLPEPARTQLETTPVGQIVQTLVRIQSSYLVVKITGRRKARTAPFSEVRGSITSTLIARHRQAAFNSWLQAARRKADIQKS